MATSCSRGGSGWTAGRISPWKGGQVLAGAAQGSLQSPSLEVSQEGLDVALSVPWLGTRDKALLVASGTAGSRWAGRALPALMILGFCETRTLLSIVNPSNHLTIALIN